MGVITDLETRINNLKPDTGIETIIFDRDEAINEDSKNNYPMVIYRVTGDTIPDIRRERQYPELVVEFLIGDLYYQGDTETIAQKQDNINELLLKLITSIPDYGNSSDRTNNFELLSNSTSDHGWELHNDNLIVVKRRATIRGFQCIPRI
jgi:hypothetical protein